jgi:hypothetical protein
MPAPVPSSIAGYQWASYTGDDAIVLASVLIVAAAALVFAGTKLRTPLSVSRPGRTVSGFMIAIWLLAICTFFVALGATAVQLRQVHLLSRQPKVRVGTLLDAMLTFLVVLYITRRFGWRTALASAVIGTAAAPMFFELPFDLIVMGKTYPPIPPLPMLYRGLFFLPLFLIELTTISLLTLLPTMRITGTACYALAAMFAVFAVWAVFGFAFPSEPLPLVLNIISKVLCFVAAIMLFVWPRSSLTPAPRAAA